MTGGADSPAVLIADDSEGIRSLIRFTLDTGRFRIVEAPDGETAVAQAQCVRPALVFLDWAMPGRSGVEVCRALRADPSTAAARIVMVSARTRLSDRKAAIEAGADDYVVKPFSPMALLELVAEVLGPDALAA